MKGFNLPRKIEDFNKNFCERAEKIFPDDTNYFKKNLQCALPTISLVGETALTTAVANDNAADLIFAQQVLGLGKRGDILFAISTSGNSANVLYAAKVAKVLELEIISLTGRSGGKLKNISDVTICAPADETFKIANPIEDLYDTVTYAKGKHKRYYNPDTRRYKIMENKDYSKLWITTDLYKLTNGDNNLVAYITYLLQKND